MRVALALVLLPCACRSDPLAGALDPSSDRPFRVWVYTASSLEGPWRRSSAPLAAGLSSLGLHDEGEGRIALTGLPMGGSPGVFDELFPALRVWGLVSAPALNMAGAADPTRWQERTWDLDDPGTVAAIDPQRLEGAFWYYAARGRSGDPALADGPHEIRSSPPATSRASAAGLADPSPVVFHGEQVLFATQHPDAVVRISGGQLRDRWPGVSVPFAASVGEQLVVLAQAPVGGRRQPVWATSADGSQLSSWTAPLDLGPLQSCTSPVLGRLVDGWMIACVEEPGP